ncbi:Gfo/Idh/MocA family protein [Sphaerimonospora sp. CA-214678]|uniref:Gfo/Idh/MocA family protein n=1 Tax=Sphaerimonospora sp. CA-214678 TaxID=3240029 RepID=UPI003D8A7FD1
MAVTKPFRAAVVGLGRAGHIHTAVLRSLDDVTLVAVADPDPVRRAAFDSVHTAASAEDLLELELDYCVVATPITEREQVGLALAAAGIPALIEGPIAPSLPAAMRLAEAFDNAGLLGAVIQIERYNPAVTELGVRLRGGDFGSVYQVTTRRYDRFHDPSPPMGVVTETATHDVDLAMWLTGSHVTSVAANVARVSGCGDEDHAVALLRLSGGEIAEIQVNRISPYKERVVIAHTDRVYVVADALTHTITHYAHDGLGDAARATNPTPHLAGKVTSYEVPDADPFRRLHEAFRDALLGLPSNIATLRQGAAGIAATEAILAAARTGTCVTPTDHILPTANLRAAQTPAPVIARDSPSRDDHAGNHHAAPI